MTRFQQELSGRLGMFWKKSAEKLIQKTKEDIATGKITIDKKYYYVYTFYILLSIP